MAVTTSEVAGVLEAHQSSILESWVAAQLRDGRVDSRLTTEDELGTQCRTFLTALVQAGREDGWLIDGTVPAPLQNALEDLAARRERLGMHASGTAVSILSLKDELLPFLLDAYGEERPRFLSAVTASSRLIDSLALLVYDRMVRSREETITQQAEALMEISTPVVQVWDGVVAAPLIGTLDSERTHRFMERLLTRIVETNSPVALVDITGVPAIDTQTAQHLIDTINAVKLLGSQVILTGVRPSIAQTLVHLGISLNEVRTRSSFAAGLRVAMHLLELKLSSTKDGHE